MAQSAKSNTLHNTHTNGVATDITKNQKNKISTLYGTTWDTIFSKIFQHIYKKLKTLQKCSDTVSFPKALTTDAVNLTTKAFDK